MAHLSGGEGGLSAHYIAQAMTGQPCTFRRLGPADLPLIGAWRREPEMRLWWGDPREPCALIEGDLSEPALRLGLVAHAGVPMSRRVSVQAGFCPGGLCPGGPAACGRRAGAAAGSMAGGYATRTPSRPARSWMNCQATRPEREPRVTCHSRAWARSASTPIGNCIDAA